MIIGSAMMFKRNGCCLKSSAFGDDDGKRQWHLFLSGIFWPEYVYRTMLSVICLHLVNTDATMNFGSNADMPLFTQRIDGWRSRFGGAILFAFVTGFLCLTVVTTDNAQQTPDNGTSVLPSTRTAQTSFPLYGVELNSAPRWQQLAPDRSNIITRWISPESRAGHVQGMIMIEMKKPGAPEAGQIAASLAKNWNGTVSGEQDVLDGEVAWRIVAEPKVDLQPVEGLVSLHDGRLYLIEGGVTAGHSCHDEIEIIRKGWKWIPLDPPVKHLEFRDQPALLFNGHVSINFPAAMSQFDNGHPENSVGIGLENYQLDRGEFTAMLQFAKLADGDTLSNAEDRLGKGIQAQLNLPDAFVWHRVKSGLVEGDVTQALPGPASDGKNWIMWGIAGLPGNQIVLANFTIYAEDPNDRAIYAKTAEKIVNSVSLLK
jgi:hypothetical protein